MDLATPARLIVALAGCALAVLLNTGVATGQPATPSTPISTPPPGSGGTGDDPVSRSTQAWPKWTTRTDSSI
ncbi:hypothetical protein ABZX92_36420, partial [Lentzea sp. NPDC006480]|uniref:hypothetical protein n=1 Tax=Lentzea sp. NPDC006480 TaxID=3157176 RepID=UPI0033B64937